MCSLVIDTIINGSNSERALNGSLKVLVECARRTCAHVKSKRISPKLQVENEFPPNCKSKSISELSNSSLQVYGGYLVGLLLLTARTYNKKGLLVVVLLPVV